MSSLNEHNIKATFYTQTTLRSLSSKPKDLIPEEDRNNAVYQLNCKDCEAICVGETKRTLNIRAEEDITAINSANKKCHTAEHCWKYNHDLDWEHKKVLDFQKNWKTRTIKEAIYSEDNEHHINGISFKLPNTTKKQSKENSCQNYNIIKLSLQRSKNKYSSIQIRNQSRPIRNDLKLFRSSANT